MKIHIIIFISLLVLLLACDESKQDKKWTANGIWQQEGYGKIFLINNDTVKIYDICQAGCNIHEQVPLMKKGKIESIGKDSLTIRKNIKTYKFFRLEKLPEMCSKTTTDANNPTQNFEMLWHTFNEQYCYFEKRNIDWQEIHTRYKSNVASTTNELALYQLFEKMLGELNDGHVQLEAPEHLADTLNILKREEKKPTAQRAKMNRFELADTIAKVYCEKVKTHNAGIAKWGMMQDNIAYVQLNAMWLLAYYDVPTDLPFMEFVQRYGAIMDEKIYQRQDEIDGADLLMDSIVNDVKQADALILDLRFNTGGKDEVGLEVIAHLVNAKKRIGQKKARGGAGYTNHQQLYVERREPNFKGKVYVLTSPLTASAAEIALLATLQFDKFIRIGSNTEGIYSDGLDKRLPNGWTYTLSNEVYEDIAGNNYESVGISPDVIVDYPTPEGEFINHVLAQLNKKGDAAIEKVFELVELQKAN